MKKIISFALVLMCMLSLCACEKKEDNSLVSDICGAWDESITGGTQVMTFYDDMTYHCHIILESYGIVTENESTDKYEIDGDKITIHYSKYGKESVYKVSITDDKMTLTVIDNPDAVREFTRKK